MTTMGGRVGDAYDDRVTDTRPIGTAQSRPRGVISWSSILAGALTAIGVLVLLTVTALAAGLELAPGSDANPRFGTAVGSILTGIFIVLAFGSGGLTAVWAAGHVEPGPAILHGFLVWALALFLILALVAVGLGAAFGDTARIFGPTFEAANDEALERAGWSAVLGLALGAGSAILGGLLATREEISRVW
jgi:hypothetical protein